MLSCCLYGHNHPVLKSTGLGLWSGIHSRDANEFVIWDPWLWFRYRCAHRNATSFWSLLSHLPLASRMCDSSLWRFNSLVQHFWQHHRFFPHFLYPLAFKQKLCATVLHGHQAEITSAVWSVDCGSDGHQIPRARLWIIHWAKHLVMSDLLTVFSIGTNDYS